MRVEAQSRSVLSLSISEGMSCNVALEQFRIRYGFKVAYDPQLSAHVAPFKVELKGYTPQEVFAKLCEVYRLEFLISDPFSYLVRSSLKDVEKNEEKVFYIQVKESRDAAPVAYAAVFDESRTYFGFTDEFGDCFIRLPDSVSNQELVVHSLAHVDTRIRVSNNQTTHSLILTDDPVISRPVQVRSFRKQYSTLQSQATGASARLLEAVMLSSVFTSDVARSVQLLPGVSALDDAKAGIRIRGANEESTLLMLDQMPVYKADHFFGVFGAFNSLYIRQMKLYKNNIPVEYGGRTSGLLYLESNPMAISSYLKIDANLLYSSANADIHIGKGLTLKIGGRKSYSQLAKSGYYDLSQRNNIGKENLPSNLQNIVTSRPSFNFYDLNARLLYQTGKHQVDLNIFRSADAFSNAFISSFKVRQNTINEERFTQENLWYNQSLGLNYLFQGEKAEVKLNSYFTEFNSQYDLFSFLLRREPGQFFKDTLAVFNENNIADIGLKASVSFGEKRNAYIGVENILHRNYLYIENENFPIFESSRGGYESSLWGGIRLGNKTGLYAEPAVRFTRLHALGQNSFLPQVYISYNAGLDWLIKASAGKHLQYVRQFDHENVLGQRQQFFALSNGTSIPTAIGYNTMFGLWKSYGPLVLDIEAYYRWLDGSLMHASQMPGLRLPGNTPLIQGFRLYEGNTRTAGVDFSLIYEKPSLFSMLTYTLSKTDNRFSGIFDNNWFPSVDDSRHQIKWVNTYSFKSIEASIVYVGATGRPYVDVSQLDKLVDRATLNPSNYQKRLPNYHRIDTGLAWNFTLWGLTCKSSFSVFNIFDRTNVKYRQFFFRIPPPPGGGSSNTITSIGSDVSQLERTINLSLQFQIDFRKKQE